MIKVKHPLARLALRKTAVSRASHGAFARRKDGDLHGQSSWELDNCPQATAMHSSCRGRWEPALANCTTPPRQGKRTRM